MKKTLTLLSAFLATQPIFSRVICDTTCHAPDDGISNYAVVSPIGRSIVQHVTQAPRLTTLDNKTIAVVGVSFMAHITHPEIKRLLETHYKNVTVLLTDEMGYAGPYPGMGIDRPQAEAFKQKLIEHHVITGDTARNKVQVMPSGGYSTVKVQVPSDWNELTQAKGYEPIESFYLNEGEHDLPTEVSTINEDNVPVIQQGTMLINQGKGRMDIFDAAGKLVGSTTSTFNLRKLPIGVYIVRVDGVKGASKVVKSH